MLLESSRVWGANEAPQTGLENRREGYSLGNYLELGLAGSDLDVLKSLYHAHGTIRMGKASAGWLAKDASSKFLCIQKNQASLTVEEG